MTMFSSMSLIIVVLISIVIGWNLIHAKNQENVIHSTILRKERKIAFLFLTVHNLPFEEIWQEFFTFHAPKEQFNIYIHAKNPYYYSNDSIFYNRMIPKRIDTRWGSLDLVKAARLLVESALEDDPKNYYFALFSESCLPLYSFPKYYRILTQGEKSIVNSCPHDVPWKTYLYNYAASFVGGKRSWSDFRNRWRPILDKSKKMKKDHWRKGGQWFMLIRPHAQLFQNFIEDDELWETIPIPDEHFVPTLLSMHGLENETTCSDGFTNVNFENSQSDRHPLTYHTEDIHANLFHSLRYSKLINYHNHPEQRKIGFQNQCAGGAGGIDYSGICHFNARKFSYLSKFHLLSSLSDLLIDDSDNHYYNPHPPPKPSSSLSSSVSSDVVGQRGRGGGGGDEVVVRYPNYDFHAKLWKHLRKRYTTKLHPPFTTPTTHLQLFYLEQHLLREIPNIYSLRFFFRLPLTGITSKDDEKLIDSIPKISKDELRSLQRHPYYHFPVVSEGMKLKEKGKKQIWLIENYWRIPIAQAEFTDSYYLRHQHQLNNQKNQTIKIVDQHYLDQIPVKYF